MGLNTEELWYYEEDEIRALLLGHTVTKVDEDTLTLDDGTVLTIIGNDGCGGCSNGHYSLDELNDCPNNAIMNIEFDEDSNPGGDDVFRLYVYAEDTRIKLLEVSGHDNGYYGVGYWIEVQR